MTGEKKLKKKIFWRAIGMDSKTTKKFRKCFATLPEEIKNLAKKNYDLWLKDPYTNGLRFKNLDDKDPKKYSIRVGNGYRALGDYYKESNIIYWYWIGSHEDYNNIINQK